MASSSNSGGIVIPLTMIGDGYYNVLYTLPLTLSSTSQVLPVQLDTGSSDVWLVSSSCSSSSCSGLSKSQTYDSASFSTDVDAGVTFQISYLEGDVAGEVYFEDVSVGGYVVEGQALASATTVQDEPLSLGFSGVLGLALPDNSVISQLLSSTSNTDANGNTLSGESFLANLFGLSSDSNNNNNNDNNNNDNNNNNNGGGTGIGTGNRVTSTNAPVYPFFGMTFASTYTDRVPSQLSIGMHPFSSSNSSITNSNSNSSTNPLSSLTPSAITYAPVVPDPQTQSFLQWMLAVEAISVYVNGVEHAVDLSGANADGSVVAVVDSGTPAIVMSPSLASGVWGAMGISPSSDGNYYIPCTTPLNITVTLLGLPPLPLHPLDLSAPPTNDPGLTSSSDTCTGLIQQNSGLGLSGSGNNIGGSTIGDVDIVLGIPFLRNMYTVLALEEPNTNGSFNSISTTTTTTTSSSSGNKHGGGASGQSASSISPYVGFYPLVNSSQALNEFNQVRVLHQSLNPSSSTSSSSQSSKSGHKGISAGLGVLFGLIGFFALGGTMFVIGWFGVKKRMKRGGSLRRAFSRRSGAGSEMGEGRSVEGAEMDEREDDNDAGKDYLEDGSDKRSDKSVLVLDRPSYSRKGSASFSFSFSDSTLRDSMSLEHLNINTNTSPSTNATTDRIKRRPSNLKLNLSLSRQNVQFTHVDVDTEDDVDKEESGRSAHTNTSASIDTHVSGDESTNKSSSDAEEREDRDVDDDEILTRIRWTFLDSADPTSPRTARSSSSGSFDAVATGTINTVKALPSTPSDSTSPESSSQSSSTSAQRQSVLVSTPTSPPVSISGLIGQVGQASTKSISSIEEEEEPELECGYMAGIGTHSHVRGRVLSHGSKRAEESFAHLDIPKSVSPTADYFSLTPRTDAFSGFYSNPGLNSSTDIAVVAEDGARGRASDSSVTLAQEDFQAGMRAIREEDESELRDHYHGMRSLKDHDDEFAAAERRRDRFSVGTFGARSIHEHELSSSVPDAGFVLSELTAGVNPDRARSPTE